jgi:hypothetical protein
MVPLPCSRIWRSSYFMQFQTPRRLIPVHTLEFFTAHISQLKGGRLYPSVVASGIEATKGGYCLRDHRRYFGLVRDIAPDTNCLCPEETRSSAAERTAFSLKSASATAAPSSAKALEVTRPMPEPAPVTSATLFSKDEFIRVDHGV